MKLRPALRALGARSRHPALWLGAVVMPLIQGLPLLFVPPTGRWTDLPVRPLLAAAGLLWCFSVLFAGLPFQWTGDDRPQAGFGRGLLQWLALELLLAGLGLSLLPWNLPAGELGEMLGAFIGGMSANLLLILLLNWILVRGETGDAEVAEAEQRAHAAERLVGRQTLSPRTIHTALARLLEARDPNGLERGLVDLAVLFRTRLMLQTQAQIPFAQERSLVDLLLKVLQRAGRLPRVVHQDWAPDLDALPVASLAIVQVVEILADLLETCPIDELTLVGHRRDGALEVRLTWYGATGCALLERLEHHPDFLALERRLSGSAQLREPLTMDRNPRGGSLCLRLPGGCL